MLFDGKTVTIRKRNVRRSLEQEGAKRRRNDENAANEDEGVTSLAEELKELKLENKNLKVQNAIILAEVVEVNAKLDRLLSRD